MANLEHRILQELVYERVRLLVDLYELMAFEADLASSIERALASCARAPEERAQLVMEYLHDAWARLGEEVLGELASAALEDVERGRVAAMTSGEMRPAPD